MTKCQKLEKYFWNRPKLKKLLEERTKVQTQMN